MAIKTIKSSKFEWTYVTDFGSDDLSHLKKNFKFHPLDLKDCAGELQRSKIDTYKNYLFIVLQLPVVNGRKVSINQIYFFLGKNYLVTITKDRSKVLNNLFYKIVNNPKMKEEAFSLGSGYLFYKISDSLLRSGWSVHTKIDKDVARVESDIYEGRGKKSVFEIAELRRLVLQLKAIIDPQKIVTNSMSRTTFSFIDHEMNVYFDDLDDFVEKNWLTIEGHKERLLNLQEINESLISYRTNQIMKVLTIFSVLLLPLTLLSGIYGMNIDLPLSERPTFVWSLFLGLLMIITGIFIYLKKKDWI